MKKIITILLLILLTANTTGISYAAPVVLGATKTVKPITYKPNARTINYAFIFDGPSTKNSEVLKQFKTTIIQTTAPDYKAGFSEKNIFVGNWTEESAKKASEQALNSNATMVISLGYLSSKYLNTKHNKGKFVVTIDQYGLRDIGADFFNPVQQSVKGILFFNRLAHFKKVAILMNDSFYKTQNNWENQLKPKLKDINFGILPVNNNNIQTTLNTISAKGYDAVVLTPLFNLSAEKRKELIDGINAKKILSFSTTGKDDVKDGILLGAGAYDLDRKVAEATSFNIKGVLDGNKQNAKKIYFYEDEIVFLNKDTADAIGYDPHLRILNNAEVISNKQLPKYTLTDIFNTLDIQNIDIERKSLLVKAAKRASLAAMLRYLPTFQMTLGYQQYNHDYAESTTLLYPEKTGVFQAGLEQIIYSPALVTNILVKKKKVSFQKEEARLAEQNLGIQVAQLYIDELILENLVAVQKEDVLHSRENLAIARVREKMGKCGQEEAMRWATQLYEQEQQFLAMKSDLKNVRLHINKLLNKPEMAERFRLAELKATDPAFYTSEIHIINYVSTPNNMEKFIKMLVEEAYKTSPELAKLKAAQKMKQYEKSMYYQKFFLPDAKVDLTYTSLINREFTGDTKLPAQSVYAAKANAMANAMGHSNMATNVAPTIIPKPEATNLCLGIWAKWKPIEGGTKIAEIARINAEIAELKKYEDAAKLEIEDNIRSHINNAIAGYFSIEKDFKGMYAAKENYKMVQNLYLKGKAPIQQMMDAQVAYKVAKARALNTQNSFFKELIWVQRGICAVNWTKAPKESHDFIANVKKELQAIPDFEGL
ncbi:MAG: TolC family protein [bacterium]|nr:TolC family protein [bacterium]